MTAAASSYRQKYAISLIRGGLQLNREQRYYLSWYVTRGTFAKITYQEEIDSMKKRARVLEGIIIPPTGEICVRIVAYKFSSPLWLHDSADNESSISENRHAIEPSE